jgi:hypothetical protein
VSSLKIRKGIPREMKELWYRDDIEEKQDRINSTTLKHPFIA